MSNIIVIVIAFLFAYVYGYFLTKQHNANQPIYEDGPKWHASKQGTPTKGGKIFVIPTLIIILITYLNSFNFTYLILFIILLSTFLMGLIDDNGKISHANNESGLSAKQKLVIQFIIALIVDIWFFKTNSNLDLVTISALCLIPFVFVGMTNATNLTDGLDGLLASISIISFTALYFIAMLTKNSYYSLILLVFIICLLVFFLFNKNPAKIFMGDTGSLFIGAFFTFSCIYLKLGILGLLLGAVYIFEMFSVIIQVTYFRYTRKKYGEGKRLLLMAPFHHHLEKLGFSEKKIVLIFSIIQIAISLITVILYINMYASYIV